MTTLKTYLESVNCYNVQPVTVTIGKQTYAACKYRQNHNPLPNAPMQAENVVEAIYCIGLLPPAKLRGKVCFTIEGDSREWYVAGYCPEIRKGKQATEIAPKYQEFNPFGPNFLLMPWDSEKHLPAYRGQKIDHYEDRKYKRVPIIVE